MKTEDGYIIRKCLDGDSAAFGILVDKYKGGIYALAYSRLRNFHDAEDVTQEVFVKAYQKLRTLRRWDNFHAWLYAITSNLCKDWARSRSRRPDREFIDDEALDRLDILSLDSFRERNIHEAFQESLNEALDSLPETHRQVLTLFYLGGMSGKEISVFLGMSHSTIRQRLYRARSQLKEEMLAMMTEAFETQKLQADFTIHIVEAIKQIKILPMPKISGLAWGLSLAIGIMITVLNFGMHVNISSLVIPAGSPPAIEIETQKTGHVPVDILKTSEISIMLSDQVNNSDGISKSYTMLAPQQNQDGKWTKKSEMLSSGMALTTAVANAKIYAIGGENPANTIVNFNLEYDPVRDEWIERTEMSTKRSKLVAESVDGKIYVMGGATAILVATAIVEEYDPAMDEWLEKREMPTKRYGAASAIINGKIFVIGGYMGVGGASRTSKVEVYDPKTDTWEEKAPLPERIGGLTACEANGKIYVMGGMGNNGVTGSTFEYDAKLDKWNIMPPMPHPAWWLSACSVNGKIYAIGGDNNIGTNFSSVREFDPETQSWTLKHAMNSPLTDHSAIAFNDNIYIMGGTELAWPGQALSTVRQYSPMASGQSIAPHGKIPTKWGEVRSE